MTDEEVSDASKGTPGEIAPPCPEASVVDELKAQGLPVGPCDPQPEVGNPVVLPTEAPEQAAAPEEVCPVVFLNTTAVGGATQIKAPCGVGAEITDFRERTNKAGVSCATVTYVVTAGKPARTESVCVGDASVQGKPSLAAGGN